MRVHLNIGSNRGHRRALIERAVVALSEALPGPLLRSGLFESEPWGFSSPHRFLNLAVAIDLDTPLPPLRLLDITQEVQNSIDPSPHRTPEGGYADRAIDIDIIAVDRVVLDHPRLTLPHPRARLRDFVILPLRQIDPETAGWIAGES